MMPGVAIVGGGPAGMTLALALRAQGVTTSIYEARPRQAVRQDKRILAISHGSMQLLASLGIWDKLAPQARTGINTIHISHQGGLGKTLISAQEQKVPALGYVVAAGDLATGMDQAIEQAGIPFYDLQRITAKPDAALTVWAEGMVDSQAAVQRDYGQHAIICTAESAEAHQGRAWERFTPLGPVAALPYGHATGYAVVLTCPADAADQLAALPESEYRASLQARFGGRVRFTATGPRFVFPLGLRFRKQAVAERQVWIGNAAQTLHPAAGQGFNLAMRDIMELADSLADASDPGHPALLARYAARRRLDRYGMIGFTDTLVRVFSNNSAPLRHARGAGLLALDLLPAARSFVAKRMMLGARGW